MEKTYEAHYAESADMTFIVCDEWNGEEIISTEVVGFYYGKPNEESTEYFKDKGTRCEYE